MSEQNRKYTNGEINVYWQPKLCVHAAICLSELPKVFNPRRRPWVDLSQADTGSIIQVVNACPTNALMFSWVDEQRNARETSSKVVKNEADIKILERKPEHHGAEIKLQENGPAVIMGNCTLELENGEKKQLESPLGICRCGKSSNMPFCDGSHAKK